MHSLTNQDALNDQTIIKDRAYRKITLRLIPFLILLFLLAWLNRVNVGFAKISMLDDLQFSEAVYGLGAGIFFIGYFLFELPSNIYLEKIGAKKTLARITILWGITSAAMMFVTTPMMFYVLRFLLGVFEAGFFPGVVLYITYWFPMARRAKINGLFMTSFAIAGVVGNPLAGFIMSVMGDVGGLSNWQWLFIIEGIPSVIAGIFVLLYLPNRPHDAKWLTKEEQDTIVADIAKDHQSVEKEGSIKAIFKEPILWLCCAIYFCIVAGNATIAFWSPSIVQALGVSNNFVIGLISAIPFLFGTVAMVWWGASSDKSNERKYHTCIATLFAGIGLILTGFFMGNAVAAMVGLVIGSIGILAAFPVFWSLPSLYFVGGAVAATIAVINSVGNLAGFVAPYMIGFLKTKTDSLASGLYFVGALELLAVLLVLFFIKIPRKKA
ncbi:MFS transporter [Ignatzschineria cameli]|uniref:MFS transporter n=1 Tax=Ignatzschineria cameli TaxID=2182793 RepID=UPI000D619C87|nr:MFS transporter [Ignatzschineria cameli]PWD82954.1 MFS transporter [Ignatzschineria cameli]